MASVTWVECRLQVGFLDRWQKTTGGLCYTPLCTPFTSRPQVRYETLTKIPRHSIFYPLFCKILSKADWMISFCDISPSWTSAFPLVAANFLVSGKPRSSSPAMVFHHPALAPSYNLQMSHADQWELILQAFFGYENSLNMLTLYIYTPLFNDYHAYKFIHVFLLLIVSCSRSVNDLIAHQLHWPQHKGL